MIRILLTAILLKGYEFGKGAQIRAIKTGPVSLELSRCISFYLMIDLITQTVVKEWQLSIELRY